MDFPDNSEKLLNILFPKKKERKKDNLPVLWRKNFGNLPFDNSGDFGSFDASLSNPENYDSVEDVYRSLQDESWNRDIRTNIDTQGIRCDPIEGLPPDLGNNLLLEGGTAYRSLDKYAFHVKETQNLEESVDDLDVLGEAALDSLESFSSRLEEARGFYEELVTRDKDEVRDDTVAGDVLEEQVDEYLSNVRQAEGVYRDCLRLLDQSVGEDVSLKEYSEDLFDRDLDLVVSRPDYR